MSSFTFSAEQLRSAPIEVRHWLLSQIEPDVLALAAAPAPSPPHAPRLAACTPDEAARLFELIRQDFAAVQVLFELAREMPAANGGRPLYALSIAEMIRHTRLDGDRLVDCLRLIDQVFQQIHPEPDASLFGFDQANHVYIHEATHRSIRALWEALVRQPPPAMVEPQPAAAADFMPPRVGPSEDVAAHRRQ